MDYIQILPNSEYYIEEYNKLQSGRILLKLELLLESSNTAEEVQNKEILTQLETYQKFIQENAEQISILDGAVLEVLSFICDLSYPKFIPYVEYFYSVVNEIKEQLTPEEQIMLDMLPGMMESQKFENDERIHEELRENSWMK